MKPKPSRREIERALRLNNGMTKYAATSLGVSNRTLARWLDFYRIPLKNCRRIRSFQKVYWDPRVFYPTESPE